MAPNRIMFIRHAEKPDGSGDGGVTPEGVADRESLTVRGWKRAGALARFFLPRPEAGATDLTPNVIFAAGTGPGSESKRPMETVAPLVALLKQSGPVDLVTRYLKDDVGPLIADVTSRDGIVLVAWEHRLIPSLVGLLPQAPSVPQTWPDDRFDLVWILDRSKGGWAFSQLPQLLLPGDRADPIA